MDEYEPFKSSFYLFLSFLFILFSILILLSSVAFAFQVSPAAKRMTNGSYQLRIINNQQAVLNVTIHASAPIVVEPATLILPPGEERVTVTASNQNLSPGLHKFPISIRASPASSGQFSKSVTLVHALTLIKRYNGSYIMPSLSSSSREGGALLTLSFENLGERATTLSAVVNVQNTSWNGSARVEGAGRGKLSFEWRAPPGEYEASARVTYLDNNQDVAREESRTAESRVVVGTPQLCLDLPNSTFTAGRIVALSIPAFLTWNKEVNGSLALFLARGDSILASVETPIRTFIPGPNSIRVFIEVPDSPGNATLEAGSEFGGKSWNITIAPSPEPAIVAVVKGAAQRAALPLVALIVLLTLTALLLRQRLLGRRRT